MQKHINLIFIFCFIFNGVFSQTDNCLLFDGIDDYVSIGDVNNLGTSNFTIEAWINISSTVGNGNKIINKGLTTVGQPSNAGYALRASRNASDELEFSIGNTDGTIKSVFYYGLETDTWYHVAGVRDETKLYLYLDGVLVSEDSTQTIFNVDSNIPLAIGAIDKGTSSPVSEYMAGYIDEVRIWDTNRTADEIMMHKDCAITSAENNLLSVYNLNETMGNNATDSSGNDLTGELIGSPTWIESTVAPICVTSSNNEIIIKHFRVSPNPFSNEIMVEQHFENNDYILYNSLGKIIKVGIIENVTINLKELPRGIYILTIHKKDSIYSERIIKE